MILTDKTFDFIRFRFYRFLTALFVFVFIIFLFPETVAAVCTKDSDCVVPSSQCECTVVGICGWTSGFCRNPGPNGYCDIQCNHTGGGGGGGGGNDRCGGVAAYKYVMPGNQMIAPAAGQSILFEQAACLPGYTGSGACRVNSSQTADPGWWYDHDTPSGRIQQNYVGSYTMIADTPPAGYSLTYNVVGADYGSGPGTGTTASFYCGNGVVTVNWYYTPINADPIGNHDSSSCTASTGWTCDADNYNATLQVHFYANGPAGTGTFLGAATANLMREPAVGANCGGNSNHGFSFTTPDSLKDGAPHSIYAYAINTPAGNNPLLSLSPKTITCTPLAWWQPGT